MWPISVISVGVDKTVMCHFYPITNNPMCVLKMSLTETTEQSITSKTDSVKLIETMKISRYRMYENFSFNGSENYIIKLDKEKYQRPNL